MSELYDIEIFKKQLSNMEVFYWDIGLHATYFIGKDGVVFSVSHINKKVKKLKTVNSGRGYKAYIINGKTITAHRMVAKTFIPNPNNKTQVNHIDGNKDNNHVDNLEWVTQNENMQHAYDTGLRTQRKFTNAQIKEIKEKYKTGNYTHRKLAEEYNVNHSTIGSILRGNSYRYLY